MKRALAAGLLLAAVSCSPSSNTLNVTIESYITAVSLNDTTKILAASASYQRERMVSAAPEAAAALAKRYRDMIESGYMAWESSKYKGEIAPDPLGVALIRAIGLGKEGAASLPMRIRFEQDDARAIVTARAITNYDSIRWSSIPTGGRMYLMGHPFGKVVNYATGYDDPSLLNLLATVDIEWTLVKIPGLARPEGAPSDWYIEKVEPLPETATAWSPPATAKP